MSTSGSGSGQGNVYAQLGTAAVNAGINYYAAREAAKEQKKAAQAAAQPRYTYQYSTPYMNERIAAIVPYILQSQQQVFENRMKGYGAKAPDFTKIADLLAGISPTYSGVGGMGGSTFSGSGQGKSPFEIGGSASYGGDSVDPQTRALIEQRKKEFAANRATGTGKGSSGGGIMAHGGIQRRTDSVFDGSGGVAGLGGGSGALSEFDRMFAAQRGYEYTNRLGRYSDTATRQRLEDQVKFNEWARSKANDYPWAAKILLGLGGAALGAAPGIGMIPGATKGAIGQLAFGSDADLTAINGVPSYYFGPYREPVYNKDRG